MKVFNIIRLLTILTAIALTLDSCNQKNQTEQKKVVSLNEMLCKGSWSDGGLTVRFFTDGTSKVDVQGYLAEGKWTCEGNKIIVRDNSGEKTEFTIENDVLYYEGLALSHRY